MDWKLIIGLVLPVLVVIGLIIYVGMKLQHSIQARAENKLTRLTMTGTVLYAFLVASWIWFLAARELAPESSMGTFVQETEGLVIAFAFSIVATVVAGALLEFLGIAITRGKDSDD